MPKGIDKYKFTLYTVKVWDFYSHFDEKKARFICCVKIVIIKLKMQ